MSIGTTGRVAIATVAGSVVSGALYGIAEKDGPISPMVGNISSAFSLLGAGSIAVGEVVRTPGANRHLPIGAGLLGASAGLVAGYLGARTLID